MVSAKGSKLGCHTIPFQPDRLISYSHLYIVGRMCCIRFSLKEEFYVCLFVCFLSLINHFLERSKPPINSPEGLTCLSMVMKGSRDQFFFGLRGDTEPKLYYSCLLMSKSLYLVLSVMVDLVDSLKSCFHHFFLILHRIGTSCEKEHH